MPRGGKCPGAGAPKGNLNAIKHGRNSQQLDALLSIPRMQEILAAYYRRQQRRQRQSTKVVRGILQELAWHIPPLHDNQHPLGPLLQDFRYNATQNDELFRVIYLKRMSVV